jgi:hypothetical protein
MTALADAFRKFKAAERAAVEYRNDSLTSEALQQERARRLASARDELRKASPAEAGQDLEEAERKRQQALDALAPTNADSVAVIGNEWAKVEALLDAGRNLAQLIEDASALRIAAILDRMPTRLVITSEEPDAALAEITDLSMKRLAVLGNPSASAAAELYQSAVFASAWQQVIAQAAEPFSEVSVSALTALYNASPDDHEVVQAGLAFDAQVQNAIRQVDASRTPLLVR